MGWALSGICGLAAVRAAIYLERSCMFMQRLLSVREVWFGKPGNPYRFKPQSVGLSRMNADPM